MKKLLLLVLSICMATAASAQSVYTLETTLKKGANPQGEQRLVSNDERNICFRTIADRMYADLNPATHPDGMYVIQSNDFGGFTQQGGEATLVGTRLNQLPWINKDNNTAETPDWIDTGQLDTYYGDYSGNANHYVDLTGYAELRIFRSSDAWFRAFFWNADGSGTTQFGSGANGVTWNADGGYWSLDLSKAPKYQDNKIYLKCIKSNYQDDQSTVTDIQVYKTEYVSALLQEDALNTLHWINRNSNTEETPTWNVGNPNADSDTYYGNYSDEPTHNVDLSAYDELRIYRTTDDNNKGFRAFFINAAGNGTNNINDNSNGVSWNATGKYWTVDLSKVEKSDGKVLLKSIKSSGSGNNNANTVSNITVCQLSPATISRPAKCTYTYEPVREVGTFSYSNVRTGYAAVNLFNNLKGKLTGYENFVIRTLNCTTPLTNVNQTDQYGAYVGDYVDIRDYNGNVHGMQQTHRYCLQFCDENNAVIHEAVIYSENMKVIQLKEFFSDDQFNNINSVWFSTSGGDTDLSATIQIKEAYFITPYDLNYKGENNEYPLGMYYYDMDDVYLGNAFIHPSYFMMENGVTVDEVTGVIELDPQVYAYQDLCASMYSNADAAFNVGMEMAAGKAFYGIIGNDNAADLSAYNNMYVYFDSSKGTPVLNFNGTEVNASNLSTYGQVNADGIWQIDLSKTGTQLNYIKAGDATTFVSSVLLEKISLRGTNAANGEVNKDARIQLSVPFEGFDMSDVTMVSMDNAEDGDVMGRWICGYLDYFRGGGVPEGQKNDKTKLYSGEQKQIFLATANENPHDIRTLYTSRYNAEFRPPVNDGTYPAYQEYKTKVNNIWWETANRQEGTNTDDRTEKMTIYDICITKNHVIARNGGNHTKLNSSMYNNTVTNNIGSSVNGGAALIYGTNNFDKTGEDYADLGNQFYKMQIKGTPEKEIVIIFNCDLDKGIGTLNPEFYRETFVRLDSKGLAVVDLKDIYHKDDNNCRLNRIMTPWGATGETKIDYIKLYGEEDGVIDLTPELFHTWIRDENVPVTRRTGRYSTNADFAGIFDYHVGTDETVETNKAIFGTGDEFHPENYAELTGYKTIRVYGTPGMVPRLVFNCVNGSKTDDPKFNAIYKTIPAEGYVDFDLTPYAYFHLNTLKNHTTDFAPDAIPGKVSRIVLISDERVDYVLEGNGTLSETPEEAADHLNGGRNGIPYGGCALDAINDVGARVIDARPRVNLSRSTLVFPENPNCLYLMRESLTKKQAHRTQFDAPFIGIDGERYNDANDWKLKHNGTNPQPSDIKYYANMVKIDGILNEGTVSGDGYLIGNNGFTSDEINIFDGYSFSAPRDINVTSATLRRKTVGGEGNKKVGTLILPFAANNINGTAYDTFASRYAQYPSEDNGILEDTHINKGDHVLLFEKHSGDVQAYWPYLYVASIAGEQTEFTYSGKIGKTPEVGSDDAPGEYMTNEAKANEAGQRHFLRGFMESTHVENAYGYNSEGKLLYAKNATVAPFRVMIQSPQDINIDRLNEDELDPNGQVKVVRASDFIDNEPTAIENVADIDGNNIVDVYTIGGTQIKKNVKAAEALRNLPKGVYVVGGKKVVK